MIKYSISTLNNSLLINYLGTHLAQQFDNLTVKAVPCIHNEDFYYLVNTGRILYKSDQGR